VVSESKNPRKVAAGQAAARVRWAGHAPGVVRIADLTSEQRRLIVALIDAARSEKQRAAADLDPATADAEGHGHGRPTS